ncbi:MAG: c-type cytochrome domain-containing protein [Verrucomicrobiales bacterium]
MKTPFLFALLLAVPIAASEIAFFENKIRPVLVKHCYECHSQESGKSKGGLQLDTRDGIRTGGDTGPAVVPGDLEKSLLIQAIRWHDPDTGMPPEKKGGKLPDPVIADLEAWVKGGAGDPRDGKAVANNPLFPALQPSPRLRPTGRSAPNAVAMAACQKQIPSSPPPGRGRGKTVMKLP